MSWNRFGIRIAAIVVLCTAGISIARAEQRPQVLRVGADDVAFTVVGQVTNTPPDQSIQYGYIPTITGLTDLFSSPTENESTAFFTFFTQATTKAVRHDGTLTIIEREGTTTIYYNTAPNGNLHDPATFKEGDAVLVMDLKQQVVLDTVTTAFTVVNVNGVVSTNGFENGGKDYALARKDSQFRTTLTGHLKSPSPPSGYFAGYAVVIGSEGRGIARVVER